MHVEKEKFRYVGTGRNVFTARRERLRCLVMVMGTIE